MNKNKQWHYWNNKHNSPEYNYTNVSISKPLIEYIDSLSNINCFLDHGCGHGRVSKIIYNKFPHAEITINDIVPTAIEKSKQELLNCNLYTVIGRLHHISGSFDCIISHRVIHSCQNYKDIFREIYRLLSDNGTCFVSGRSINCIQKEINKDFFDSNNNTIEINHNGRFTKLFNMDEFIDLAKNAGLKIKKSGNFSENAAKSGKENEYLYIICSK